MPSTDRSSLLAPLTTKRLRQIAYFFDLRGRFRSKEECIETISRYRRIRTDLLLRKFRRTELRQVCDDLNISATSQKKKALIAGILSSRQLFRETQRFFIQNGSSLPTKERFYMSGEQSIPSRVASEAEAPRPSYEDLVRINSQMRALSGVTALQQPFTGYKTNRGRYWVTKFEQWVANRDRHDSEKKFNLIFTSPPFPLQSKKRYGNLQGEAYIDWLRGLAKQFSDLLTDDGSLVIEIGNAWNENEPTMSVLPMKALLAILESGSLHLCQEFICHNPARLPTPVNYVNIQRIRLKDSWTRLWWMSKTPNPKANNRNVLLPYSKAMKSLLRTQKYNAGMRPSEHRIGEKSFLKNNGGAIPASCLTSEQMEHYLTSLLSISNTKSFSDRYFDYCKQHGIRPHPARMQEGLAKFFISLTTDPGDLVLDPFAGTNTTGWVAETLGRRWVSTEINLENMAPSAARFVSLEGTR